MVCGPVLRWVNRVWRWSELAILGGGNGDAPENANSDTANTIIAAIHIFPCGLTYIVCERLACESLPMICWPKTLTGIQNF